MGTDVFEGAAIMVGYAYTQRLVADAAIFPEGATFAAQVRGRVSSDAVLTTLTTGAGISRISDTEIEVTIPADATANMPVGTVVMDVVRTDTDPEQHMQFLLEIPVQLPVTRGLG